MLKEAATPAEVDFSQRRRRHVLYGFELDDKPQSATDNVILARFPKAYDLGYRRVRVSHIEGPAVKIQVDTENQRASLYFEEDDPEPANFIVVTRVSGQGVEDEEGNKTYLIQERTASEIQVGGKTFGSHSLEHAPFKDKFKHLVSSLTEEEVQLALPYLPSALEYFHEPGRQGMQVKKTVLRASARSGMLVPIEVSWRVPPALRINVPEGEEGLLYAFQDSNRAIEAKLNQSPLVQLAADFSKLLGPEIKRGNHPMDRMKTRHEKRHPKKFVPMKGANGKERWVRVADHLRCTSYFPRRTENALQLLSLALFPKDSQLKDTHGNLDPRTLAWVLFRAGRLKQNPDYLVKPAIKRGLIPKDIQYEIYTQLAQWVEQEGDVFPQDEKAVSVAETLLWSRFEVKQVPKSRQNAHVALDIQPKPKFTSRILRDRK